MKQGLLSGIAQKLDLRYTPKGSPVLEFRIVGKRNLKEREVYHSFLVKVFGRRAEELSDLEGKAVLAQVVLSHQSWEADGKKQSKLDLLVGNLDVLTEAQIAEGQYGPYLDNALNRFMVWGNLTYDVDLSKTTHQGLYVAKGSLAVNEYKDGESRAHFINLEAWNDTAMALAEFKRGQRLYAAGSLKLNSWESEGQRQYRTVLEVDYFKGLTSALPRKPKAEGETRAEAKAESKPGSSPDFSELPQDLPF